MSCSHHNILTGKVPEGKHIPRCGLAGKIYQNTADGLAIQPEDFEQEVVRSSIKLDIPRSAQKELVEQLYRASLLTTSKVLLWVAIAVAESDADAGIDAVDHYGDGDNDVVHITGYTGQGLGQIHQRLRATLPPHPSRDLGCCQKGRW